MKEIDDESLRRQIEEFFDLPADIRHLPLASAGLAYDLSYGLEAPAAKEPLENFFDGLSQFPFLEGFTLMLDAMRWSKPEEPVEIRFVNFWHFIYGISHQESREDLSLVRYITAGRNEFIRAYYSSEQHDYSNPTYFSLIHAGQNFNSVVAGIIRRSFAKNSGILGMGREEDYPPAGFVVVKIDRPKLL